MNPKRPLDPRLTEQRNPRSTGIDQLSTIEIVDLINAEDRMVAQAVGEEREQIARCIDMVVDIFKAGGRLFYIGAGTSGRLGVLDSSEMPPTYGIDPEMVQGIIAGGYAALVRAQEGAEDRPEDGARDLEQRLHAPSSRLHSARPSYRNEHEASTRPAIDRAAQSAQHGDRSAFHDRNRRSDQCRRPDGRTGGW